MGRPIVDRETLEAEGVQPSVINAIMALVGLSAAMGHAGALEGDGVAYQNVVCRFIDPDWVFYGGRPDTPLNPDVIPGLAGGGEITVERDNTLIHAAATILNFSTNFTVVDAGGGQVDIDVTGGGGGGTVTEAFKTIAVSGQSDIVADLAADTLTIAAGTGLVITNNAGTDTITFALNTSVIAQNSFTTIAVSGQSNVVADSPTDTLTLIAGSNVTITTNAAGDSVTINSSYVNTTYTAGAGIDLVGTKFSARTNELTHVGLVDPTSGNESSADGAEIGILWYEIADYDVAENMLIGHEAGDSTNPVVCFKTVEDWLKTLPGYDTHRVLVSDETGIVKWYTVNEMLDMLTGRNDTVDQSIGADATGSPEWQDDTDECPEA